MNTTDIIKQVNKTNSPLFNTDGYKLGHSVQLPDNTNFIYSNFSPRSNKWFKGTKFLKSHKLMFVGFQAFIKRFLIADFQTHFFDLPKTEAMAYFKETITNYVGDMPTLFSNLEALHDLGYLPIKIKALAEGSMVNMNTPVFTICNTDNRFAWLVGYLEDILSNQNWKACTVGTLAYNYRVICEHYAQLTCDNNSHVAFQMHDFSQRGLSGMEDSRFSSIGHLASFIGSDNIPSIANARALYNSGKDYLYSATVPATEHMIMCMGTKDNERETYRRLIEDLYPEGIVSIVSDTWNLWNVLMNILPSLSKSLVSRKGKVVIRPDSGNPEEILLGKKHWTIKAIKDYLLSNQVLKSYTQAILDIKNITDMDLRLREALPNDIIVMNEDLSTWDITKPVPCTIIVNEHETVTQEFAYYDLKGVLGVLCKVFGDYVTTNSKGYIELPSFLGVLYGDSITIERAENILERMKLDGYASNNVLFGVGSYTYQYITRDTFGFAMKATYGEVNGLPRNLLKDPVTDSGMKKSRSGLLRVDNINGELVCTDLCTKEEENTGELKTVFENSTLLSEISLADIRKKVEENLVELRYE